MKRITICLISSCFLASCSTPVTISSSNPVTISSSNPTSISAEKDISITISVADEAEHRLAETMVSNFIASKNYGFEVEVQFWPAYADAHGKSAFEEADILYSNVESISANIGAGVEFEPIDAKAYQDTEFYADSEFKEDGTYFCYPFSVVPYELVYYDKSVFAEEDLLTWDAVLAKAATMNRVVSWDTESIFAKTAFFYGAGATTEFTYGKEYKVAAVDDTYASNGLPAAKAMSRMYANECLSPKPFGPSDGVVPALSQGGIWNLDAAKTLYGDNLGIAPFPGYLHNGGIIPCKAALVAQGLVVKATEDAQKKMVANDLARLLSSAEAQKAYAEAKAEVMPAMKGVIGEGAMDELHRAVAAQANQGFALPNEFDWLYTYLPELEGNIRSTAGAATDQVLQGCLDDYHQKVIDIK